MLWKATHNSRQKRGLRPCLQLHQVRSTPVPEFIALTLCVVISDVADRQDIIIVCGFRSNLRILAKEHPCFITLISGWVCYMYHGSMVTIMVILF